MSARWSTALPRACSGAMYAAVPSTTPASVIAGVVNAFADIVARTRLERLRDTKVEHLDDAVAVELDVRGLQIPVHDAVFMRGLERSGDLQRDGERLVRWQRALSDAIGQREAVDELHDERRLPPLLSSP